MYSNKFVERRTHTHTHTSECMVEHSRARSLAVQCRTGRRRRKLRYCLEFFSSPCSTELKTDMDTSDTQKKRAQLISPVQRFFATSHPTSVEFHDAHHHLKGRGNRSSIGKRLQCFCEGEMLSTSWRKYFEGTWNRTPFEVTLGSETSPGVLRHPK